MTDKLLVQSEVKSISQGLSHGVALLQGGRVDEAVEFGESLAALYPEEARVHAFVAEAYNAHGCFDVALNWIDKAILQDENLQHKLKKAWLLSRAYRRDEVSALIEEVVASANVDGRVLWQAGKLYYHHNQLPQAIDCYERALAVGGEHPGWLYDLGLALFYSGNYVRAEECLDRVLTTAPHAGSVHYLRSTLRKQTRDSNHVAELESRLRMGVKRDEDEAGMLYALAKELEDLGDYDKAFAVLQAGASKKRGAIRYDAQKAINSLREIQSHTHAQNLANAVSGHEGAGAIFIVGMPRTGTTLTERILLQSGNVRNAGELSDFDALLTRAMLEEREKDPALSPTEAALRVDFEVLGRKYMRGARQMVGGSSMFIDKMPVNYLYCGMIHKALPDARIVHLVRDPLDTCYAIYKTLFFDAYEFSYDQDELAEYYIAYRRLMQHWHETMPGVILDVSYESLVTDTEAQARRIYAWCGLEWTPRALETPGKSDVYATASAAQVREPVHSRSVNSSRRYERELAPLVRKLTAAGLLEIASTSS